MASFEHQHIAKALKRLDTRPDAASANAEWIRAKPHLSFLKQETALQKDDLILYANLHHMFIYTALVREDDVIPPNQEDLLEWGFFPQAGRADYAYTYESGNPIVRFENIIFQPTELLNATRIFFGRERSRIDDIEPIYYELLQEFAHVANLHWRADQSAYCRIDPNGDLESVVSITVPSDEESMSLITCKREPLECFLATSDQVLIRFFDFMMVEHSKFTSWDNSVTDRIADSQDFFYKQCLHSDGHAYTRGVQILPCLIKKQDLYNLITEPPTMQASRQYANFTVRDWRHDTITNVSTDPKHTTSYYDAANNDLPYELSPAFFRPDVLLKYKADRDKYIVDELGRRMICRRTWELKGFDINEAGQVSAYICDLRNLPYQEQLYWQSHNEKPKGDISKRAVENDFKGEPATELAPLEKLLMLLGRWSESDFSWWGISNQNVLLRVNTPITDSRDEWAEAFLELTHVVAERFRPKELRSLLDQRGIAYEKNSRSLILLEKLIRQEQQAVGPKKRLDGLREAQNIRNKVKSHVGGREGKLIFQDVLMEHGTFRNHFSNVCDRIVNELEEIEHVIENPSL